MTRDGFGLHSADYPEDGTAGCVEWGGVNVRVNLGAISRENVEIALGRLREHANGQIYSALNIPPELASDLAALPSTWAASQAATDETLRRVAKVSAEASESFYAFVRAYWPMYQKSLRPRSKRWRRPKRWRARHLCEDMRVQAKGFRGIVRSAQRRPSRLTVVTADHRPSYTTATDCLLDPESGTIHPGEPS